MRDQRLRQLDRQARQGDPDAAHWRIVERLRRGTLDPSRLRLAAYLGDLGARSRFPAVLPAPPDLFADARVVRQEVVLPAQRQAQRRLYESSPHTALDPLEFLGALGRLPLESRRGRREAVGWVDAYWSGLGLPRASDLIRVGLWVRHLPTVDPTVRARAALAAVLRAWSCWRPATLAAHGDALHTALRAVVAWTQAPSPDQAARVTTALAALPPARSMPTGAEALVLLALRQLRAVCRPDATARALELVVWRVLEAISPPERRSRQGYGLDPDTPLNMARWVLLGAQRAEREQIQDAIRELLVPWAIGERDPLADWLAGRPLRQPWAPTPRVRRTA